MMWSILSLSIFLVLSTTVVKSNDDDAILLTTMMVNDLNSRYANGKASDDYGEIGIILRMIDGVCNPVDFTATCDYNMANVASPDTFFGGTIAGPNDIVAASYNNAINTPTSPDAGDRIGIFESWATGWGPAAGLVYFPCAAEKSTRCMWPTDGSSDQRPLSCGRLDISRLGDEQMLEFPGCSTCISENNTLPAEENTVNGRTITRMDDIPTEANITTYEIELLFNRANKKTVDTIYETSGSKARFKELSSSCEQCKSSSEVLFVEGNFTKEIADIAFYSAFVTPEYRWYEGPGYYGTIATADDDDTVTKPSNELKQMIQANLDFFGPNRDYTDLPDAVESDQFTYNEWAMDGNVVSGLEEDRKVFTTASSDDDQDGDSPTLNFEGMDGDGTCGAAIKALVMICGDQDDPFYYGKAGQCLDFADVYKKKFGTDSAPPVVYFNQKNFTHPFSSTCDIEVSCGVTEVDDSAGGSEAGNALSFMAAVLLSIVM